ncbi:MAG: succinate dehydrogenase/fumarate reductase iron-sulfur subunit [Desulfomonilaceae bacterium]
MKVTLRVFRFDPATDEAPYYRNYTVDAEPYERILDCLNKIKWEEDGTLAYRMSCAHGVCGSDAMKINGRCALACQKLVKDCEPDLILVEPLPSFAVLKDLIVDLTPFFERVNFIRPYLIADEITGKERIQLPEERKKMGESIRCILCACCTSACPVVNENDKFMGPAPLIQAFRRIFDSRDTQKVQRLEQLDVEDGVWACLNHYECTRVCPKDIPVTKYINTMKREIKKIRGQ